MSNSDKKLIELFINEINAHYRGSYQVCEFPDVDSRDAKAVDAIAVDLTGARLAIEHTLLQPFSGEREDAVRFMKTAGVLDRRTDLAEAGWSTRLTFRVGSVPKGADWDAVGSALEAWFRRARPSLKPGSSRHTVTELGFPFDVGVEKQPLPGSSGKVFISREMSSESIEVVLRIALSEKLPKLTRSRANSKILLLEVEVPARGDWEIGEAVEGLRGEYPQLADVSTVWTARTTAWDSENFIAWHLVWPLDDALNYQGRFTDEA